MFANIRLLMRLDGYEETRVMLVVWQLAQRVIFNIDHGRILVKGIFSP